MIKQIFSTKFNISGLISHTPIAANNNQNKAAEHSENLSNNKLADSGKTEKFLQETSLFAFCFQYASKFNFSADKNCNEQCGSLYLRIAFGLVLTLLSGLAWPAFSKLYIRMFTILICPNTGKKIDIGMCLLVIWNSKR